MNQTSARLLKQCDTPTEHQVGPVFYIGGRSRVHLVPFSLGRGPDPGGRGCVDITEVLPGRFVSQYRGLLHFTARLEKTSGKYFIFK